MTRQDFLDKARDLLEVGRQASTESGGEKVREVCLKFARSLSTIDFKLSEQMVQVFTNGNNFVPSSGAGRFNRISPARKKKLQEAQRMQEAARMRLSQIKQYQPIKEETTEKSMSLQMAQEELEKSQTHGADAEKSDAVEEVDLVDLALQDTNEVIENESIMQEEFDFDKDPDVKTILTLGAADLRNAYNSEAIKALEEKFMRIYPDMNLSQYGNSRQKLAAIRRYIKAIASK